MKFDAKYAGKWVAAKDDKVIASDTALSKLRKKIGKYDPEQVKFALIPRGYIVGEFHEI